MSFDSVTQYEKYLQRALQVVSGAPYFKYVENQEFARLAVDGEDAVLSWLEIASGYEGYYETEKESATFPASLLLLPYAEFSAWQDKEKSEWLLAQKLQQQCAAEMAARAQEAEMNAILTKGVVLAGKRYKLVPQE